MDQKIDLKKLEAELLEKFRKTNELSDEELDNIVGGEDMENVNPGEEPAFKVGDRVRYTDYTGKMVYGIILSSKAHPSVRYMYFIRQEDDGMVAFKLEKDLCKA